MFTTIQLGGTELVQFGLNYGFAGGIALLFWRYITTVQKEQTECMQELTNEVRKMNNYHEQMNDFFRGGEKPERRN